LDEAVVVVVDGVAFLSPPLLSHEKGVGVLAPTDAALVNVAVASPAAAAIAVGDTFTAALEELWASGDRGLEAIVSAAGGSTDGAATLAKDACVAAMRELDFDCDFALTLRVTGMVRLVSCRCCWLYSCS